MQRPTLAAVMEQHAPAYLAQFAARMPETHFQAVRRIRSCGTEAAGRLFYQCPQCADWRMAPASCGHRACNACGHAKALEWQARQEARLLPVPYLLITFTVPSGFRRLFRGAQEVCYDVLFKTAAAVLQEIAADPRHLGGEIGMTGVLHTWTRDMRLHPHIHFIVPAGALREGRWIDPRPTRKGEDFFLPVKVLSTVMRNRMMKALRAVLTEEQWRSLPAAVWRKRWNVNIRRAGKGDTALGYLARYVQKTALDASRIVSSDPHGVTFAWTERKTGIRQQRRVTGQEFMRLFLQHVLPTGFMRVRHFGFLSAAAKKSYAAVQSALAGRQPPPAPPPALPSMVPAAAPAEAAPEIAGTPQVPPPLPKHCCPRCRVKMDFIEYWPVHRPGRGPPGYVENLKPGFAAQCQLNLTLPA